MLLEISTHQHHFAKPARDREIGLRSRLDFDRTIGDTGHSWTSLLRMGLFFLITEAHFYARWLLVTPRCASRGSKDASAGAVREVA